MRLLKAATVLLCLAAIPAPMADAQAPGQSVKREQCFLSGQFENWRAADARTIYIRVRPNRFYRLDLQYSCPQLLLPDTHLITRFRGSDMVCSALDWDMQVAEQAPSIATPCTVKTMTPLSAAEAASLPAKAKP